LSGEFTVALTKEQQMNGFLAAVKQLGNGLVYIEPLSSTDPGYGVPGGPHPDQGLPWGPGHPDQGLPSGGRPDNSLPWGPGHPSQGLPWTPGHPSTGPIYGGGRPDQGLPVPPPAGVVTPPIVLPGRPNLPTGSGVVVPFPAGAPAPAPKAGTDPSHKPFILWYGPGTQSQVVFLPPSTPEASPKA
jgi:hypothetical protein